MRRERTKITRYYGDERGGNVPTLRVKLNTMIEETAKINRNKTTRETERSHKRGYDKEWLDKREDFGKTRKNKM